MTFRSTPTSPKPVPLAQLAVRLHPEDDVAIALADLDAGAALPGGATIHGAWLHLEKGDGQPYEPILVYTADGAVRHFRDFTKGIG